MNILVLAHFQNDISPSCIFVHAQAKAYKRLGHTVTEISPVGWVPFLSFLRPGRKQFQQKAVGMQVHDGIPIYYPRYLSLGDFVSQKWNGYNLYRAAKKIVRRLLKTQKIDVIHAHMLDRDGYAATLLKKKFHIPVVITSHGSDLIRYFDGQPEPYLLQTCHQADKIVLVSEKLRKVLSRYFPVENTEVIYNGIENYPVSAITRNPYGILSVGSLIPQKKFDVTIRAFAKVKQKFPMAELTIAGQGEEREHLQDLARECGVADSVHFAGYIEHREIFRFFASNQMFVLPSVGEGFGIVYLEAMNAGCIPFGTAGEGIDGTIRDGENGYLVPPDDAEGLADRMIRLLEMKPDQIETLRSSARETARGYTWENNAMRYLEIFQRLMLGEKNAKDESMHFTVDEKR